VGGVRVSNCIAAQAEAQIRSGSGVDGPLAPMFALTFQAEPSQLIVTGTGYELMAKN
jgi:hypothetical protein